MAIILRWNLAVRSKFSLFCSIAKITVRVVDRRVRGEYLVRPVYKRLLTCRQTFDYSSDWVRTSYSIDGGNATTVTSHSGTGDTYKQLFWKSDDLVQGDQCAPIFLASHQLTNERALYSTLKVTMEHVNTGYEDGEGTIWFDFFEIYGGDNSTSSATGNSSEPTSQRHERHPNVGAIVGGVLAGVFLFCLALILGVFFARKRKARKQTKAEACDSIGAFSVDLFVTLLSQNSRL